MQSDQLTDEIDPCITVHFDLRVGKIGQLKNVFAGHHTRQREIAENFMGLVTGERNTERDVDDHMHVPSKEPLIPVSVGLRQGRFDANGEKFVDDEKVAVGHHVSGFSGDLLKNRLLDRIDDLRMK